VIFPFIDPTEDELEDDTQLNTDDVEKIIAGELNQRGHCWVSGNLFRRVDKPDILLNKVKQNGWTFELDTARDAFLFGTLQ
jgi:hypothetical protein